MEQCPHCGGALPQHVAIPQAKFEIRVEVLTKYELIIDWYSNEAGVWLDEVADKFGKYQPEPQFRSARLKVALNYDAAEVKAYLESYHTPETVATST